MLKATNQNLWDEGGGGALVIFKSSPGDSVCNQAWVPLL